MLDHGIPWSSDQHFHLGILSLMLGFVAFSPYVCAYYIKFGNGG